MGKSKNTFKKRTINLLIFLLLTGIEILIALFVHDNFIRPFVGDIIVVAVIYYFVRIFFPLGIKHLLVYIFIFAVIIEYMQLFNLMQWISGNNKILKIVLGSSFSVWDIVCYAVGCLIIGIVEEIRKQR